jgi:hypothetical protein
MNRFLFPSFDHFSSYCLTTYPLFIFILDWTRLDTVLYKVAGLDSVEETLGSLRKFAAEERINSPLFTLFYHILH